MIYLSAEANGVLLFISPIYLFEEGKAGAVADRAGERRNLIHRKTFFIVNVIKYYVVI